MSQESPHKLFNYSVAPPTGAWEVIATAMDDQTSTVATILDAYEQPAPSHLWDKISQALEPQETHSVPQFQPLKKRFSFPRMISAAAVLLLVAALITLYINKADPSTEIGRQPAPAPSDQGLLSPDSGAQQTDYESPGLPKQLRPAPSTKAEPLAASKVNRYVVMAKEDGNTVRLSKKAFTVFDCAENSAPHNKERCKENIQLMQQKMAASMLSPSGDFGGLIDMIKSLEEND